MSNNDEGFMNNEKLYDLISEVKEKVHQVITDLNNGLKSEVKRNTENISSLEEKIDQLKGKVERVNVEEETKEQVKINMREWLAFAIAILSSITTILSMTGVIGG